MNQKSNLRRQLSEVVSLEVWLNNLPTTTKTVSLHADVSFKEAIIGGDDESSVSFKLSIERATVHLMLPLSGIYKVDPNSVARDGKPLDALVREIKKHKDTKNSGFIAKVAGSLSGKPKAGFDASLQHQTDSELLRELELEYRTSLIVSTQSLDKDRNYQWELKPLSQNALSGKVWDPVPEPRASIIDMRDVIGSLDESIEVQVRCLRKDLRISDITIAGEEDMVSLLQSSNANKLIAVEAYILNRLADESLHVENISRENQQLILSSVLTAD